MVPTWFGRFPDATQCMKMYSKRPRAVFLLIEKAMTLHFIFPLTRKQIFIMHYLRDYCCPFAIEKKWMMRCTLIISLSIAIYIILLRIHLHYVDFHKHVELLQTEGHPYVPARLGQSTLTFDAMSV